LTRESASVFTGANDWIESGGCAAWRRQFRVCRPVTAHAPSFVAAGPV